MTECTNCGYISAEEDGPCHRCLLSSPPRVSVGSLESWREWTQTEHDDGIIDPVVLDLLKGD